MRLGGATEVAAELGISRQRLAQIRDRPGFPEPVGEIAAGSIWDLDAIMRWSDSRLRRSSGRPKKDVVLLAERYVLDDKPIASGGFADVYRATDISKGDHEPNAVVAIKVLRDFEDDEIRRRFQRELRLVAECLHPNIVRVLDQGQESSGRLWYAMPLTTGSLTDAIDRFPGNDDRIAQVMGQICAGVTFVHDRGIYHRDLKPPNILLVGHDTWAVSDFGLARGGAAQHRADEHPSRSGHVLLRRTRGLAGRTRSQRAGGHLQSREGTALPRDRRGSDDHRASARHLSTRHSESHERASRGTLLLRDRVLVCRPVSVDDTGDMADR